MKHIVAMWAAALSSAIVVATAAAQRPELVPPTAVNPPGTATVPSYPAQAYPPQAYPGMAYPQGADGGGAQFGWTGGAPQAGPGGAIPYPGGGFMYGGAVPPPGAYAEMEAQKKRYGLNPYLASMFDKDKNCADCKRRKKDHPLPVKPPPPPVAQGGTLVYPNHQFIRGPRDYFMYGERGAFWGE